MAVVAVQAYNRRGHVEARYSNAAVAVREKKMRNVRKCEMADVGA